MSAKSDYLENAILDHVLGGPDYVRVATVELALFNVAPGDAGPGTEVTGAGYSRVAVTNDATNFPNASGGTKFLATEQVFPISTGDWGTVVAMAIFESGGNMLYWANLVTPQAVPVDRTAIFRVNKIMLREE